MAHFFIGKDTKDMGAGPAGAYDVAINLDTVSYVRFHTTQTGPIGARREQRTANVFLCGHELPEFTFHGEDATVLEDLLRRRNLADE